MMDSKKLHIFQLKIVLQNVDQIKKDILFLGYCLTREVENPQKHLCVDISSFTKYIEQYVPSVYYWCLLRVKMEALLMFI